MRRFVILLALVLATALPGAAAAAPTFVFTGHGYGHGIGMPQYGAEGFAAKGWKFDEILAHYYSGTELGPGSVSKIRVLLASGKAGVEISSDKPFTVRDAKGNSARLPAGSIALGPDLTVSIDGAAQALVPPVQVRPGGSPLRFAGRAYRGRIVISRAGGGLQVVNRLSLEKYLYGVVPGEMPPSWQPEALKAQAVAARSYALVSRKTSGSFDVFADTRSQVYGGIGVEDKRTTAAVNATRGLVVLWDGKVAWTFFHSSSGGRTAAIEDVWPGSEPLPYLVSVDDPHDTISPHHDWGPVTLTAEQLEQKLGSLAPTGITGLQLEQNASGRVGSVTIVGATGEKTISGWDMRIALGLRSTWFTIETLTLEPSQRKIRFGQRVTLRGAAPGTGSVTVEHRPKGSPWDVLGRFEPGPDGRFETRIRPRRTTFFRATSGDLTAPRVRVVVTRRVTLKQVARRVLAGATSPAAENLTVTIQRKSGRRWETLATTATRRGGAFRAKLDVEPGVYRALVSPARGLARGASKSLKIDAG